MLHGAEHHTVLDDLQFESASDGGGCLGRSRMLDTSWKAGKGVEIPASGILQRS